MLVCPGTPIHCFVDWLLVSFSEGKLGALIEEEEILLELMNSDLGSSFIWVKSASDSWYMLVDMKVNSYLLVNICTLVLQFFRWMNT